MALEAVSAAIEVALEAEIEAASEAEEVEEEVSPLKSKLLIKDSSSHHKTKARSSDHLLNDN